MPVSMLNTVVLPAPLGPMMLRISPSCTSKVTPSTARKPPNSMVRSRTSSRATAGTSRGGRGRRFPGGHAAGGLGPGAPAGQPNFQPSLLGAGAQQPVGPQDHDDDQEGSVKHQPPLGDGRGHRPQELGQVRHDPRPYYGAQQVAQAAENDHGQ